MPKQERISYTYNCDLCGNEIYEKTKEYPICNGKYLCDDCKETIKQQNNWKEEE